MKSSYAVGALFFVSYYIMKVCVWVACSYGYPMKKVAVR